MTNEVDLTAVVHGGDDFLSRINQLQTETAAHKKALDDLALGKSAAVAHTECHRILNLAKTKRDEDLKALAREVHDARQQLKGWKAAEEAEATGRVNALNAKLAEAEAKLQEVETKSLTASLAFENARKQSDQVIADTHAKCAEMLAEADTSVAKLKSDIASRDEQSQKAMAEAMAAKAKYANTLAKFQTITRGN